MNKTRIKIFLGLVIILAIGNCKPAGADCSGSDCLPTGTDQHTIQVDVYTPYQWGDGANGGMAIGQTHMDVSGTGDVNANLGTQVNVSGDSTQPQDNTVTSWGHVDAINTADIGEGPESVLTRQVDICTLTWSSISAGEYTWSSAEAGGAVNLDLSEPVPEGESHSSITASVDSYSVASAFEGPGYANANSESKTVTTGSAGSEGAYSIYQASQIQAYTSLYGGQALGSVDVVQSASSDTPITAYHNADATGTIQATEHGISATANATLTKTSGPTQQ